MSEKEIKRQKAKRRGKIKDILSSLPPKSKLKRFTNVMTYLASIFTLLLVILLMEGLRTASSILHFRWK